MPLIIKRKGHEDFSIETSYLPRTIEEIIERHGDELCLTALLNWQEHELKKAVRKELKNENFERIKSLEKYFKIPAQKKKKTSFEKAKEFFEKLPYEEQLDALVKLERNKKLED